VPEPFLGGEAELDASSEGDLILGGQNPVTAHFRR
jgi:hypothetical protein